MQRHPPLNRPLVRRLAVLAVSLVGALLLWLAWCLQPALLRTLLWLAPLVYLGVLLPHWVGRGERLRRIEAARCASVERWGFCSRDRPGPWVNYIDFALVRRSERMRGRYFYSEWLVIHDGLIIVNPGQAHVELTTGEVHYAFDRPRAYAWDGCSPKIPFYWLAVFGTPDWWEHPETVECLQDGQLASRAMFWPLAHHASLVHDALYQFLNVSPVDKACADRLFHDMLLESGMPRWLARLYYLAVVYGGAPALRDQRNPDSRLRCMTALPGDATLETRPRVALHEPQAMQ
ncbi:MAG: hypothetical protein GAK43_02724 [Stenotrophomonas maltophilia]|nr:MAG: hypothetical protein GAK43_02724 [Stenotrophomonas maltophilia]